MLKAKHASIRSRSGVGAGFLVWMLSLAMAALAGADWKPIGPSGVPIHGIYPMGNSLFVMTDAGLWRSGDQAPDWTLIETGWYSARLLKAGSRLFAYGGPSAAGKAGIFTSTDDGRTWQPLVHGTGTDDSMALASTTALVFSGNYLIAGTENGLYRSPDSGKTWACVDTTRPRFLYFGGWSLLKHGSDLLAASPRRTLLSRNNGSAKSWEDMGPNLSNGHILPMAALGRFVIASGEKTYRLAEGSSAWDTVSNQAFQELTVVGADLYGISADLTVSPHNKLFRSADTGKTWQQVNGDFHLETLSASEKELWAVDLDFKTNRHTLLRSGDRGKSLVPFPSPPAGMVWSVAGNGATVLAASQPLQVGRIDGDGMPAWSDALLPVDPDPNQYGPRYATMDGDFAAVTVTNGDIFFSRDGGAGWKQTRVVDSSMQAHAALRVAAKEGILFAREGACLFRSDDFGKTWPCVLRMAGADRVGYDVRMLHARAADYFTFDSLHVYRSTDKGIHWENKSTGLEGSLRAMTVAGIDLYAAGEYGLFRSSDGGESWSHPDSIHTGFKDLAAGGQALFAVSRDGIFRSQDGGQAWVALNEGFWSAQDIASLAVFGDYLYLGTFTAGIWSRPLSETASAIRPGGRGRTPRGASGATRLVRGPAGPVPMFPMRAQASDPVELFDLRGRKWIPADGFPKAGGD